MEEYFPLPERRYPSPSAQRRSGEHWKARLGLVTVVVLTLLSAGMMFRLAGLGIGIAVSPLRGQGTVARPSAAATVASQTGQPPGSQQAAPPANPPAQGANPAPQGANPPAANQAGQAAGQAGQASSQAAPTAAPTSAPQPSPTTRPGQKEYVVQAGDSLFAIAQRNSTTVDALVAANNLRSRDVTLSVGQRLIIP
jgi:LysM repeat protein